MAPPKKVREEAYGRATLRLLRDGTGYVGIIVRDGGVSTPLSGDDPELVWTRLRAEVGKASPQYFGYEGARLRFLSIMPAGFHDPRYLKEERAYKDEAKAYLDSKVPLARAKSADAVDAREVARAFGRTNLLSQFELARVGEVLRGRDGPEFVRAAARFAVGDRGAALVIMNDVLRAHGQPSWPTVTYLPFLWSPGDNMFLKPTATIDFAERVGHSFANDYSPELKDQTYQSLLDLTEDTRLELAALSPKDAIDIQSFIWVVGRWPKDAAEAKRDGAPPVLI